MADPAPQATRGSKAVAIIVYTVLRLALWVAAWLLIVLLTPVKGIWAAAAGILISGAFSLVLLDRQRSAVGAAVSGFVGRINARIEAAAAAEDELAADGTSADGSADSADGEQGPQGQSVGQQ
ncbi:MAG: DUF4229 domain-containing protein [Candidatus Nanopelagicales bacterium]